MYKMLDKYSRILLIFYNYINCDVLPNASIEVTNNKDKINTKEEKTENFTSDLVPALIGAGALILVSSWTLAESKKEGEKNRQLQQQIQNQILTKTASEFSDGLEIQCQVIFPEEEIKIKTTSDDDYLTAEEYAKLYTQTSKVNLFKQLSHLTAKSQDRNNIAISGDPGIGKTEILRELVEIRGKVLREKYNDKTINIIRLNPNDFCASIYVGSADKKIEKIFVFVEKLLKQGETCIIYMDEMHQIFLERDNKTGPGPTLLTSLDNVQKKYKDRFIFIGSLNPLKKNMSGAMSRRFKIIDIELNKSIDSVGFILDNVNIFLKKKYKSMFSQLSEDEYNKSMDSIIENIKKIVSLCLSGLTIKALTPSILSESIKDMFSSLHLFFFEYMAKLLTLTEEQIKAKYKYDKEKFIKYISYVKNQMNFKGKLQEKEQQKNFFDFVNRVLSDSDFEEQIENTVYSVCHIYKHDVETNKKQQEIEKEKEAQKEQEKEEAEQLVEKNKELEKINNDEKIKLEKAQEEESNNKLFFQPNKNATQNVFVSNNKYSENIQLVSESEVESEKEEE